MYTLHRFQFASRLFYILGISLFALSLGWGWGVYSLEHSPLMIGSLFGSGVLALSIGFLVHSRAHLMQKQNRDHMNFFRPISLSDSFKAYRSFRDQAPLFDLDEALVTRAFAIEAMRKIPIPKATHFAIVELWDGSELTLKLGSLEKSLREREIITITCLGQNEEFLTLVPSSNSDNEYCQGIIHFISGLSSLE